MRLFRSFSFLSLFLTCTFCDAQTPSVQDTPRIMVYGEATIEVDADVILGYLNVYDNSMSYDYSAPYDAKKVLSNQIDVISKLGCKDFMINPKYDDLKNYAGAGPFELRFTSKEQFESIRQKAMMNTSEMTVITLDYHLSSISAEKRKQLEGQTLDQALVDAKSKGERMAKSLGVTIGTPLYVEEIQSYDGHGYEGQYFGIEGQNMKVIVISKVQVQYQINR